MGDREEMSIQADTCKYEETCFPRIFTRENRDAVGYCGIVAPFARRGFVGSAYERPSFALWLMRWFAFSYAVILYFRSWGCSFNARGDHGVHYLAQTGIPELNPQWLGASDIFMLRVPLGKPMSV